MKSKQIPPLSFAIGVPDNACDSFSSTRTISRRRDSVKLCRPRSSPPGRRASRDGWRGICSTLDGERGRERVQSTVAKGPSISIYCRTSSSSSLCAADHKRVIYAAADRTARRQRQARQKKLQNKQCRSLLRISSLKERKRAPFPDFSLFPRVKSLSRFLALAMGDGGRGDLEILQRRQTDMSSLSFVT